METSKTCFSDFSAIEIYILAVGVGWGWRGVLVRLCMGGAYGYSDGRVMCLVDE